MSASTTPATHAESIHALREALRTARFADEGSFHAIALRFITLGEDPAFQDASLPVEAPTLVNILIEGVVRALPATRAFQKPMVLRYADTDLLHGVFLVPEGPAFYFWFEREERGLLSLPVPGGIRADLRIGTLPVTGPAVLMPRAAGLQ